MADINNDGWLDIYVCRAYEDDKERRRNLAFINQKDGTFEEQAKQLGIADENYSIASSFFDYDRDGDLDLIVGNHPRYQLQMFEAHYNLWRNPVLHFSNRLFRNDGSTFKDVTIESGLLSYGHTLGVSTSDIDVDGYPDIYITVDHAEPDYLFRNNGDGTFENIVNSALRQSSKSSMGLDAGDVNHDKFPDIYVAEMLSEDHYREKVQMDMTSVSKFCTIVDTLGYLYYQMHNFLHLNNGNKTFSDISQLAGVHKSDWSWSTLFMDYDNDSWQDLYVTNGYYREIFNKEYKRKLDAQMNALGNDMVAKNKLAKEYGMSCPQEKLANYLFGNNGNLTFDKHAEKAGLVEKTISTGAAYGDLDNDGDLDLVINNIGEESFIYENHAGTNNYLRIKLEGNTKLNPVGSKVYLYNGESVQSRELLTTRGFQSGSEQIIHFGLGDVAEVEKLEIIWPNGRMTVLNNVKANQLLKVPYADSGSSFRPLVQKSIVSLKEASEIGINYKHKENIKQDYDIQVLLPHKLSEYGPYPSTADVNGDGLVDLYLSGAAGQAGMLFVAEGANYKELKQPAFMKDKAFEDGHSLFIDIDSDGDKDLLVTSSGYELDANDPLYQPRLYKNNGKGVFQKVKAGLESHSHSSSCIKASDFDQDGDIDLFIGGRLKPKSYPYPGTSALMINDKGVFKNSIEELAPDLKNTGMVQDAMWVDLDGDKDDDLIVIGEWMPISFWINENGKLSNQTNNFFDKPQVGWWNKVEAADIDGNGLTDFVFGNLGLNYKYKANDEKPFMVYGEDFDKNGTQDIVLGAYYGDIVYPVRGKTCSSEQIPDIGERFKTHATYAQADINAVYGSALSSALKYEANQFASIILYQDEVGKYSIQQLPIEAQISPINGIIIQDFNEDGQKDLMLAGNLYQSEVETGRADAGTGLILINKGAKSFRPLKVYESGLYLPNDVKSLTALDNANFSVLVGNNNAAPIIVEFKSNSWLSNN